MHDKNNLGIIGPQTRSFGLQPFGKVMPRDRFLEIMAALHFVDSEEAHEKHWDDKKSDQWDPFHKIREFFEAAFQSFWEAYGPHREVCVPSVLLLSMRKSIFTFQLSIDEQIIPFKGKWGFRVLIKGKPHPVGFKVRFHSLNTT